MKGVAWSTLHSAWHVVGASNMFLAKLHTWYLNGFLPQPPKLQFPLSGWITQVPPAQSSLLRHCLSRHVEPITLGTCTFLKQTLLLLASCSGSLCPPPFECLLFCLWLCSAYKGNTRMSSPPSLLFPHKRDLCLLWGLKGISVLPLSFIKSFNNYWLRLYYVPGIVLRQQGPWSCECVF